MINNCYITRMSNKRTRERTGENNRKSYRKTDQERAGLSLSGGADRGRGDASGTVYPALFSLSLSFSSLKSFSKFETIHYDEKKNDEATEIALTFISI